ncbi:PaaI family thioesterase [Schaalia sp. lx-260]|uniref:PaaI family thioesterase n=1 Tax=Schaalia sp. lx-260 TaxID=2899082 RepID=UPI001E5BE9AF|nr:PaaI family thioesterase [Schaalia sp. lx-260]MCD4550167.1 PaaI family thioesterase [Schaalia sp. lx-260]
MEQKNTLNTQPDPSREGGFVGAHWPGSLMERMSMEVLEHSALCTIITMPVEGNRQSAGILHGGGTAALVESAASFAAQIHARAVYGADQGYAVGIEISVSHLRVTTHGMVTATARAVHLGKSQTVHIVDVHDDTGHLIATGRVTNRLLERRIHADKKIGGQ